ncbi:MAG: hypothetical protein ACOYL6_01745 [Bacteriovoracaceae bacterium]
MTTTSKVLEIKSFLKTLENMESEQMMMLVEKYLDDDAIEAIVDHIEEFYGISDDEELGMLAQLVVTGYLTAKNELNPVKANNTPNNLS